MSQLRDQAINRSISFREKIAELARPVAHVHITFTIPKLLRAYFRRNRKLLKMLAQSANFAVKTYFSESLGISDGYSGGIYCLQSHGNFYNFHPHLHSLVLPGLVKDGTFHQQKNISPAVIARLFRARLLDMLKTEGVIRQEVVDLLLSWNHNSGVNVHIGDPIDGSDEKTIENVARYMNRSPISVERVQYDPDSGTVFVHEKKPQCFDGGSKTYPIDESLALVAAHIPVPYEMCTFYYGVYSSSYRGSENKKQKLGLETILSKGKTATVNGKITSTWARLIHKVFEVDPLTCVKCSKPMRFIAFITDSQQTRKILEHIGESTIRPPPLTKPNVSAAAEVALEQIDYLPSVDSYVIDPIYPD